MGQTERRYSPKRPTKDVSSQNVHHPVAERIKQIQMTAQPHLLHAALHQAAFATLTDRAFLRVSGSDATRWLNGMATNATQKLAPGEGNYNFFLNAQGRIQGDCFLYREPGLAGDSTFLLATGAAQITPLLAHFDKFIIMDDVELTPALEDESSLLLLGPDAPQVITALDLPTPAPNSLLPADTPGGPVLLFTQQPLRFELRAPTSTLATLRERLIAQNIPEFAASALEQLRILKGEPRFGTDIRDRELPQETNQSQALHFSKGCYLGQEIVERIHSRGQVNRLFTPLRLLGQLPDLPAVLEADGKPVGEITSAVRVDLAAGSELLALGYVRREALAQGVSKPEATLTYPGGRAFPRALG